MLAALAGAPPRFWFGDGFKVGEVGDVDVAGTESVFRLAFEFVPGAPIVGVPLVGGRVELVLEGLTGLFPIGFGEGRVALGTKGEVPIFWIEIGTRNFIGAMAGWPVDFTVCQVDFVSRLVLLNSAAESFRAAWNCSSALRFRITLFSSRAFLKA